MLNVSKWYVPGIFIDLVLSLIIFIVYLLLRNNVFKEYVYRFLLLAVSSTILLGISLGGGEGAMLLWMFMLPLVYFFYFGTTEGLIWSVVSALCAGVVLLVPEPLLPELYGYKTSYRFLLLYIMVIGLAYGVESSRKKFSDRLFAQRKAILKDTEKLEQLLDEINLLKGLLPICSGCKKIRIEKNIWEDVDNYISSRTRVEFSHSICPSCAERLFLDSE